MVILQLDIHRTRMLPLQIDLVETKFWGVPSDCELTDQAWYDERWEVTNLLSCDAECFSGNVDGLPKIGAL